MRRLNGLTFTFPFGSSVDLPADGRDGDVV